MNLRQRFDLEREEFSRFFTPAPSQDSKDPAHAVLDFKEGKKKNPSSNKLSEEKRDPSVNESEDVIKN